MLRSLLSRFRSAHARSIAGRVAERPVFVALALLGLGVLAVAAAGSVAADGSVGISDVEIDDDGDPAVIAEEEREHDVAFHVTNVDDSAEVNVTFPESFGDDGTVVEVVDVTEDGTGNVTEFNNTEETEVAFEAESSNDDDHVPVVVTVELTHPTTAGNVTLEGFEIDVDGEDQNVEEPTLEISDIDIDASFDVEDGTVDNDGGASFTIEDPTGNASSDASIPVDVSISGPDDIPADDGWGWGNDNDVGFDEVDPGEYDLTVSVPGTGVSDAAVIRVERAEVDGSFGGEEYSTPAGDLVDVDVSLGGEGYVIIGGDRISDPDVPSGFLDVLHVNGGETITINTRLLGTDADTEAVYPDSSVESHVHGDPSTNVTFVDESGEEFSDFDELAGAAEAGGVANPLVPQRYRLTVGAGETVELRDDGVVQPGLPADRSQLVLTKPEFRERADVYAAPGAPADADDSVSDVLGDANERRTITENERLVIGFEATGMWGALAYLADEGGDTDDGGLETVYEDGAAGGDLLAELLTVDEGVSLTIRQTNPDQNEPRTRLDLESADPEDASLLFDDIEELEAAGDGPTAGTMYLVIDTAAWAFTDELKPGDEFDVEFAFEGDIGERYEFDASGDQPAPFEARSVDRDRLDQQFPYWEADDGTRVATTNFTIRERTLEYDRISDDGDLLVEDGAATISGNTTLNPNTELSAEIVSDGGAEPAYTVEDVGIDDDGTFSFTFGVFDVDTSTELLFELYRDGDLYDSRTAVVVDDPSDPFSFAIESDPGDHTVTRGDTLENVSVTLRNEGDIEGREQVTLVVDDGALVAEESERLRVDRTTETDFGRITADLEPGEYDYAISVPGDEATGTLVVEPDEEADAQAEPDAEESDAEEESDAADPDEETDTGDDGEADDEADDGGETDADGEADNDDEGDDGTEERDDEERPALPLPFGTREALGGTTIVGATYILGHWV